MITWFVPVVLFVIAAFALGVIVGRLAWSSSVPDSSTKPIVSVLKNRARRSGRAPLPEAPAETTDHELPTWRMREIEAPVMPQREPAGGIVR